MATKKLKDDSNKIFTIAFRVTEKEYNEIVKRTLLYTESEKISKFVRYAALNFKPTKDDLE